MASHAKYGGLFRTQNESKLDSLFLYLVEQCRRRLFQ